MYSTQLITEATLGKFNVTEWVKEEIASIQQADIDTALSRAELFLTKQRTNLNSKARVEELCLLYTLEEAKQLVVNSLLTAIILIKPDMLIRGGKEVAFAGVSPLQAVATQIGLSLHRDQIDAVQTGIEILAEFHDLGIFDVRIVKEADRAQNKNGYTEIHGDSAVVVPTMHVSLELYHKINITQYLPPMLTKPLDYI
jgi:hypothetical protein